MAVLRGLLRGGGLGGGKSPLNEGLALPQPPSDIDTREGLGGDPIGQHVPSDNDPDKGKFLNPDASRFGETPRERPSAPPQSMSPTPAQGAVAPASSGDTPFIPLRSPSTESMALPGGTAGYGYQARRRSLFGGPRGLTAGGLGAPQDPMSNDMSDPISSLIQLLLQGKGAI